MNIEQKNIKVKDIYNGFKDSGEDGVVGYNGQLDIRPPYQREFVYKDEQKKSVIRTVLKGFPLNIMYWVKTIEKDGKERYEVLDGQQRTLSLMEFLQNNFSINIDGEKLPQNYSGLSKEQKDKIDDYELLIYICDGKEDEKLEWFRTVNIAGEELTDQELRNSAYTGEWLYDAKKKFSKTGCVASKMGDKYISGIAIRQEILEKTIKGIALYQGLKCEKGDDIISHYMANHRNDKDAEELWQYYQDVIHWIEKVFNEKAYKKEMKGLDWFELYRKYSKNIYNANDVEVVVNALMADEEVENKKGIFEYVLDKENPFAEQKLYKREFSAQDKRIAYENQKGICPICKKHFKIEEMEADHIKPYSQGGPTKLENLQMLCRDCNRQKSDKN